MFVLLGFKIHDDEDIISSKVGEEDPFLIPARPITRAQTKNIKEALNGLIQEILVNDGIQKFTRDDIYQVLPI